MALALDAYDVSSSLTRSQFVTSVLSALAAVSSLPFHEIHNAGGAVSIQPQLLTLHLLFPHILLDALDLLDRGLVKRLLVVAKKDQEFHHDLAVLPEARASEHLSSEAVYVEIQRPRTEVPLPSGTSNDESALLKRFYYVQSAQHSFNAQKFNRSNFRSTQSTGSDYKYQSTQCYEVLLDAWNCSCPAFTYAAFAATVTATVAPTLHHQELPQGGRGLDEAVQHNQAPRHHPGPAAVPPGTPVHFGGLAEALRNHSSQLSQNAATGTAGRLSHDPLPPVCKHLLACTLTEACPILFPVKPDSDPEAVGVKAGVLETYTTSEEAAGWAAGWGFA